jgi:hypothetical protein
VLKWHAFTPASVRSSTCSRVSEEKTPIKIIQRKAIKGKEKSSWRVLTSSPVIQKKELKPDIGRIISRKWFTVRTRKILIKNETVSAVNNVRNTTE